MNLDDLDILGSSILIVDDQEANVLLLERLLQESGYTNVSSTRNPQEACTLHRQHGYDLILLDLAMPAMDGFEVMSQLRAERLDAYLPVIVLTAHREHKLRALLAGARDFISKPFDLVEVTTRIRNMLETRQLHRRLASQAQALEKAVHVRTQELRASEARYRSLIELAADWHWEQDHQGNFIRVVGPVREMLGLAPPGEDPAQVSGIWATGWNATEGAALRAYIASGEAFLDFPVRRRAADGTEQLFRVSGEPILSAGCDLVGYRGVGIEVPRHLA